MENINNDIHRDNTRKLPQKFENLIVEQGNLKTSPTPFKLIPGARYTLGDLHGNAINFLSFLIKEGFVALSSDPNLSADLYGKLLKIYEEPLTSENKELYDSIINNSIIHTEAKLCLIGDDMSDRGNNDYFTLKIIEKLVKSQLRLDIVLSNHGVEFLRFRDQDYARSFIPRLSPGQGRSAENLALSIGEGIVSKEEIHNIVEKYYIPKLKAIAYTIAPNHILLYTHALVGLDTIEALAKKFMVMYSDKTLQAFTSTLDQINTVFSQMVTNKELVTIIDQEYREIEEVRFSRLVNAPLDYPLTRLVWNRLNYEDPSFDKEKIHSPHNEFSISHIHGHDAFGSVRVDHIGIVKNLDHTNGKFSLDHPGLYIVHVFNL